MEQETQQSPKILGMKVYFIDSKPVFMGYEGEPEVYSMKDKSLISKPSYLDMFKSRDLMPSDMSDVIMHNLLSKEDFDLLQKKNLIPQELEILYTKINDLKQEINQLKEMMAVPVVKSDETMTSDLGTPTTPMMSAVLEMIKIGLSGGVFDQIMKGSTGLTTQEKQLLELVGKHFSLTSKKE